MWGYNKKSVISNPEEGSRQNSTMLTPDLGLPDSRTLRNKFLLFINLPVYGTYYSSPNQHLDYSLVRHPESGPQLSYVQIPDLQKLWYNKYYCFKPLIFGIILQWRIIHLGLPKEITHTNLKVLLSTRRAYWGSLISHVKIKGVYLKFTINWTVFTICQSLYWVLSTFNIKY